ncbi:glycosyltransferase family 4 protein [Phocaeicola barnesiae]|uniref:glycosyltransferase family 4 protein n=1 Tax=Phocaeicola barnesiae TaxID=376804 RepID=UPI00266F7CEB|nr:glycosyltransferase family 4 protein [Phocaeicola barnesiae]
MKIIYCIACTCHSGGMERVLANKANYLARHGYEIVVVTTDQRGKQPFFPLEPSIRSIDLGINYDENNGKSFLNKLLHYPVKQALHRKRLKAVLMKERPDVTVSMFNNDAGFIPGIKDGSAKLLEIHFSKFKRLQYGRKGLWKLADRWRSKQDEKTVRKFDRFVVLTEEDKAYWGNLPNIMVIPNAISGIPAGTALLENKRVIAVGRYTYQKGFERLVDAWHLLASRFPDWNLVIIGDGEERPLLEQRIRSYGLERQVTLTRPTQEIDKAYMEASILASSSRYEGLPMVLLEAQSFGLPIVAFQCKCGPKDIVSDGMNGYLVPEGDTAGMAQRLEILMKDEALRKRMGLKAKESASRFNEEAIMEKWMNTFQTLAGR